MKTRVYIVFDTTDDGDCAECRQKRIVGVYSQREWAESQAADYNGWAVAEWEVDGQDVTPHQLSLGDDHGH